MIEKDIIDAYKQIGQVVYLITDEYRMARMVTAIHVTKMEIVYDLACGPEVTPHFDYEITLNKHETIEK